jgi:hypothetical protein
MSKFVFIKDGIEFDFATQNIEVEQTIVVKVKKSLWNKIGVHKSIEDLAALGVQIKHIPSQTAASTEYEKIIKLYATVPEFATRVSEWKAMFDVLGIGYDATVADIAAAEEAKFGQDSTARADFHDAFMGKRTEVMVNYQAAEKLVSGNMDVSVDDFTMWTTTSALVKWLPGNYTEEDVPALRVETIITSAKQEEQLKAEDAAL